MPTLSRATGDFTLGGTTFVTSSFPPHIVGTAKLRKTNEPALKLEQVAFTAFYPTPHIRRRSTKLDWLTSPVGETTRGYAHFAGVRKWLLWPVVYLYGRFIQIPVVKNGSLLRPEEAFNGEYGKRWPLVIFSHGLGGTRTAYSHLCSQLAASGAVVLALEHRDGTAPSSMILQSRTDAGTAKLYIRDEDICWEPTRAPDDPTALPLRVDQLDYRRHEIHLAYSAFRSLVEGRKSGLETLDGNEIDWGSWADAVQCEQDVALYGHSFGGATVFSMLSNQMRLPDSHNDSIPATKVVALDPWLEPLPSPGPIAPPTTSGDTGSAGSSSAEQTDVSKVHVLVVNSTQFTLWSEHFTRLQNLMSVWEPDGKRLLTIVDAQHVTFSDFPILPYIRTKSAEKLMAVAARLSVGFLHSRMEETLNREHTREMVVEHMGKGKKDSYGAPKRRLAGKLGDVIVH